MAKRKNTIFSSGQTVNISKNASYTLNVNEVCVNREIYDKSDLEIMISNFDKESEDIDVSVGIRIRAEGISQPAIMENYNNWVINGGKPSSLKELIDFIQASLLESSPIAVPSDPANPNSPVYPPGSSVDLTPKLDTLISKTREVIAAIKAVSQSNDVKNEIIKNGTNNITKLKELKVAITKGTLKTEEVKIVLLDIKKDINKFKEESVKLLTGISAGTNDIKELLKQLVKLSAPVEVKDIKPTSSIIHTIDKGVYVRTYRWMVSYANSSFPSVISFNPDETSLTAGSATPSVKLDFNLESEDDIIDVGDKRFKGQRIQFDTINAIKREGNFDDLVSGFVGDTMFGSRQFIYLTFKEHVNISKDVERVGVFGVEGNYLPNAVELIDFRLTEITDVTKYRLEFFYDNDGNLLKTLCYNGTTSNGAPKTVPIPKSYIEGDFVKQPKKPGDRELKDPKITSQKIYVKKEGESRYYKTVLVPAGYYDGRLMPIKNSKGVITDTGINLSNKTHLTNVNKDLKKVELDGLLIEVGYRKGLEDWMLKNGLNELTRSFINTLNSGLGNDVVRIEEGYHLVTGFNLGQSVEGVFALTISSTSKDIIENKTIGVLPLMDQDYSKTSIQVMDESVLDVFPYYSNRYDKDFTLEDYYLKPSYDPTVGRDYWFKNYSGEIVTKKDPDKTVSYVKTFHFDKEENLTAVRYWDEDIEEIPKPDNYTYHKNTDNLLKIDNEKAVKVFVENDSASKDVLVLRDIFHTKESKEFYPRNADKLELSRVRAYAIGFKDEDKFPMRKATEIAITRTVHKTRVLPDEFVSVPLQMISCSKSYHKITEMIYDKFLHMGTLVYGAKKASVETLAGIRNISGFENVEGFYEIVGESVEDSSWYMTFYEVENESVAKRGLLTLAGQNNQLGDRKDISFTKFEVESENKIKTVEYTKYVLETHKKKDGTFIKDVWLTNVDNELKEVAKPVDFIPGEPAVIGGEQEEAVVVKNGRIINSVVAHVLEKGGEVLPLPVDKDGRELDILRGYVLDNILNTDGSLDSLEIGLREDGADITKVPVFKMIKSTWKKAGMPKSYYKSIVDERGSDVFDSFTTADTQTLNAIRTIKGFENVKGFYGIGGRVGLADIYVFSRQEVKDDFFHVLGYAKIGVEDQMDGDVVDLKNMHIATEAMPEVTESVYTKYIVETHKDLKGNFTEDKWFTNVGNRITEVPVPENFIIGEPTVSDIKITNDGGSDSNNTALELNKIVSKLEEVKLADVKNTEILNAAIKGLKNSGNENNTILSNNLTKVIKKLSEIEKGTDANNAILKEQLSELIQMRDVLSELIEVGQPNTIPILIPEAKTIEYNGGSLEDSDVLYQVGNDLIPTELDPETNKLLAKGQTQLWLRKALPVNPKIKYKISVKTTQLNREENVSDTGMEGPLFYCGMASFDENLRSIGTDRLRASNYGVADRENLNEGETKEFSGVFNGYNPFKDDADQSELSDNKFDPFASFCKPVILLNWYGGKSSESILESFKVEPVEGTYKTDSGSVTYFFDKNGEEVKSKRIFRKEGEEIPEPEFWDTLTTTNSKATSSNESDTSKIVSVLGEMKLADVVNTTTIDKAIKELKESEGTSNTDFSNKLSKIITKLQLSNDSDKIIKDKLNAQITELQKINKSISDLIKVGKPNTIPILIPEAKTIEYGVDDNSNFLFESKRGTTYIDKYTGERIFEGYGKVITRVKFPTGKNIKYRVSTTVRQMSKSTDATTFYHGMECHDEKGTRINKDGYGGLNYLVANAEKLPIGINKTFTGVYGGGFNFPKDITPNNNSIEKFEPKSKTSDFAHLMNYTGDSSNTSKIALVAYKIEPVEGTYKTWSGSVTHFFDKEGKEVLSKRIFMKQGQVIEEPTFWDTINTKTETASRGTSNQDLLVRNLLTNVSSSSIDESVVLLPNTVAYMKIACKNNALVRIKYVNPANGDTSFTSEIGGSGDEVFNEYVKSFDRFKNGLCGQLITLEFIGGKGTDYFVEVDELQ